MLRIKSRYDTLRFFKKINNNIIQFEAFDTLYYTGTGDDFIDLDAIDPEGGPFISKGYKIKLDNDEVYKVIKIKEIYFDKDIEYLKVWLEVSKENNN
jgi:hypothetical protein